MLALSLMNILSGKQADGKAREKAAREALDRSNLGDVTHSKAHGNETEWPIKNA